MPLRQFTFVILLVLILSGDTLGFLWDGALDATLGLGGDIFPLTVGEEIASPQIRGL